MDYIKQKIAYQFGDPFNFYYSPHSFLFSRRDYSQESSTSIKSRLQGSNFADGQVDYNGTNLALLEGGNINITTAVPSDYDLDYFKQVFVRKKEKLFLLEKTSFGYRVYANFARYVSGVDRTVGERWEADDEPLIFSLTFSLENPTFVDVTEEVEILDHDALKTQPASKWSEDISGSNWEDNANFDWERAVANYRFKLEDLNQERLDEMLSPDCEYPRYYLTWRNAWIGDVDINEYVGGATAVVIYPGDTKTKILNDGVDGQIYLDATDEIRIWQIRITSGMSPNSSITVTNQDTQSGFTFKWLGTTNSSDRLLINTAQDYVWDDSKKKKVDPQNYRLELANSNSKRLFAVKPTKIANRYNNPNIQPPIPTATVSSDGARVEVWFKPLKSFYL